MEQVLQQSVFSTRLSKLGRWLFEHRGWVPIPAVLVLFFFPRAQPSATQYLFFLGLMALGEMIRIVSVGFAGSQTRTRGHTVAKLFYAGPYRYVRNPLYLANAILFVSVAALLGFWKVAPLVLLFAAFEYALIVQYEESLLNSQFGHHYLRYQQKVPRWIPLLRPGIESTGESFSLKKALRSERSTLILLLTSILFSFLGS